MSGWVRIPDSWLESDAVERLGSEAVLFHLSALSYSCRQGMDGDVPATALRRLWPVADVDLTVKALQSAGEWEPIEDGWHLTNWREHLLSKSEVEHRRQVSRETSERYRRHKGGDHSLCERCSFVRARDKSGDTSREMSVTSLGTPRLDSTRNVVREERRDDEGGAGRGSAGATPARAPVGGNGLPSHCPHGVQHGLTYDETDVDLHCNECSRLAPPNDPAGMRKWIAEARGTVTEEWPHGLDDSAVTELIAAADDDFANLAIDVACAVYTQLGGQWTDDEDKDPVDHQLLIYLQAYAILLRRWSERDARIAAERNGRPADVRR